MSNNNIVKIGTALKWRSTFDIKKRYYQENITTMCGCVFRCKILLAEGKPPVKVIDEAGHIAYENVDVWDVVVDMAYYYNFVIDHNDRLSNVEEQSKENFEAIKRQEQEINNIKEYNKDFQEVVSDSLDTLAEWISNLSEDHEKDIKSINQWINEHKETHHAIDEKFKSLDKHLEQIDETNEKQQAIIEQLLNNETIYTGGLWNNDLLWMNDMYWENYPNGSGSSGGGCECSCEERLAKLENSLSEIVIKYNEQQTIIDKQQKQIDELLSLIIKTAIKSYDSETSTIYFADYVAGDYIEEETLSFSDSLTVKDYDEEEEKVYIR